MERTEITSFRNPKIKELVRLRNERHRKKEKLILVDGVREIRRAMAAELEFVEFYYSDEMSSLDVIDEFRSSSLFRSCSQFRLPKPLFSKVAFGERSDGVLALASAKPVGTEDLKLSSHPFLIVLDGIEKPGNLGAVFRTAAAVGVDAILLTNSMCDPYNPNAIRASLGTIFDIPFVSVNVDQAKQFLKSNRVATFVARIGGDLGYAEIDGKQPVAIVLGSEADGVAAGWMDEAGISIPMSGSVDSLNVSVSAAIVAYEINRQRS